MQTYEASVEITKVSHIPPSYPIFFIPPPSSPPSFSTPPLARGQGGKKSHSPTWGLCVPWGPSLLRKGNGPIARSSLRRHLALLIFLPRCCNCRRACRVRLSYHVHQLRAPTPRQTRPPREGPSCEQLTNFGSHAVSPGMPLVRRAMRTYANTTSAADAASVKLRPSYTARSGVALRATVASATGAPSDLPRDAPR